MFSRAQEPQVSSEVLTDTTTERHYPSRVHGPPSKLLEEFDTQGKRRYVGDVTAIYCICNI